MKLSLSERAIYSWGGGRDQREGDRRENDQARILPQYKESVPTPHPPGILVEKVCVCSVVATNEVED